MAPNDPIDEASDETFPASDSPTFSTAHAGPPAAEVVRVADQIVRVLVAIAPESVTDEGPFRTEGARVWRAI